jgi:protein disulfide-isomerase A1
VDATTNTKLAEKFEIQGYPTLKFFASGEPLEYKGGRTADDIVNWIKKKIGPAVAEFTTYEQIEAITNSTQLLVLLSGSKSGENFEVFEKVAKNYEDIIFGITEAGKEQLGIKEGDVIILKSFDERRNDCNCAVNEDNLKNFIERNMFPIVAPFEDKVAEKIFGEG